MAAGAIGSDELPFLWWNAQDFTHYEKDRVGAEGWPRRRRDFTEKLRRVDAVIAAARGELGAPGVLALCETTRPAAVALRDETLPGYRVLCAETDDRKPGVCCLLAPDVQFEEQVPILVPDMPLHTRAMGVFDLLTTGARTRFVTCHWPPFPEARANRERMADHLNHTLHDFLTQEEAGRARHTVLLGDLNDEPFSTPHTHLLAHRARGLALRKPAWQDAPVRRVHLYNLAWRLLGEAHAAGAAASSNRIDAAGTWYGRKERQWATLDHVIVSGGLLTGAFPRLDEGTVRLFTHPACAPDDGVPRRFEASRDTFVGVSDHLPIVGRIILQK